MSLAGSAGVIGWPVAHSKSPLIHHFWLAKLELDGDYGRFPVSPGRLGEAIRALPALGLRGVNVTVPHKQAVIPFLDRLDPLADKVGAVNTVVVEGGALVGYNTDAAGFMEPIEALRAPPAKSSSSPRKRGSTDAARAKSKSTVSVGSRLRGNDDGDFCPSRTAVVIGAGGAARAIASVLWSAGYALVIANRDRDRARSLADAVAGDRSPGISTPSLSQLEAMFLEGARMQPHNWSLLVNASSLGMTDTTPFAPTLQSVDPGVLVYDIVYTPLETPLLAAARARGLRTIDGLQMLVAQAAAAFELFFGHPAPRQHDAELRALLVA